jgi:hypothetical protein
MTTHVARLLYLAAALAFGAAGLNAGGIIVVGAGSVFYVSILGALMFYALARAVEAPR